MNNPSCPVYDDDEVCPQLYDIEKPAVTGDRCGECGHVFAVGETVSAVGYGSVDTEPCPHLPEYQDWMSTPEYWLDAIEELRCDECLHNGDSCEEFSFRPVAYEFKMCPECAHVFELSKQVGVPIRFLGREANLVKSLRQHVIDRSEYTRGPYDTHFAMVIWRMLRPMERRIKRNRA